MIELKIAIQGQFVTTLAWRWPHRQHPDGIHRLFPFGRRTHYQSGGPVVDPDADLSPYVDAPASDRSGDAEIEVTLTSKDDGAMATLDGQVGVAHDPRGYGRD